MDVARVRKLFLEFVKPDTYDFNVLNTLVEELDQSSPSKVGKVYRALVSQSGTDDPTVLIQENTLGEIVWSRDSAGNYFGRLTGAFPEEETSCLTTSILTAASPVPEYNSLIWYDADSVFLESGTLAIVIPGLDPAKFVAVAADDILFNTLIEIIIAP